jgi:putative PEP-CTERM system histidine kinase
MLDSFIVGVFGFSLLVYFVRQFRSTEWKRTDVLIFVALAATFSLELTDMLVVVSPGNSRTYRSIAVAIESVLPFVWLMSSLVVARRNAIRSLSSLQWIVLVSAPLLILLPLISPSSDLYYAPDFPTERILFLRTPGYLFYLMITGYFLASLVNLEKTLTSATSSELWRIKFEVLGIGVILTAYVLYFSQGVLFRSINMQAVPLRALVLTVAVGMMIVSGYRQSTAVRIQVSRQMAFKSIVLLTFGAYLLFVGLLGEGMQYLGIPFGKVVVAGIGLLLGIALVVIWMSGRFRRQAKVLLHKNFYQAKHDYRKQWLEFTSRLASSQDDDKIQMVIIEAYCDIFGITSAMLYLYDEDRQAYFATATFGMSMQSEHFLRSSPLISYLYERQWVFSRPDGIGAIEESHRAFMDKHQVSFVVPLYGEREIEGFIVLGPPIDETERYNYEDFDLMKTIARQATVSILNQRLIEQVARLREVEAIGNISTFVIHDLKNHVAALSLLVDNARQYLDNPEFQQDMLRSLDNTVSRMQGLIGRLKNLGEKELLNVQRVDLLDLVYQCCAMVPGAHVEVSGVATVVRGDGDELQKVLLNFLINAVEASPAGSPVHVEVGSSPSPFFRVIDQGCGMSQEFQRHGLFKPFVTTKKKGLGIGLFQCRRIVEAHGGRIEVQSEETRGSAFTVWLPESQGKAAWEQ